MLFAVFRPHVPTGIKGDSMLFHLLRMELDEHGRVIAQTDTQPLYELREDAMVMAEFEAARCYSEYGYNAERDCWWSKDTQGRTFRFEVRPVAPASAAA
jgi:hypothetical protein